MPSRFCTHYVSKFGRPSTCHRTGQGQSSSQFPRKVVLKNVQTTTQLHSSPIPVRLCSKSFKLGFSITLRKGRGIRDQIANICWIIEKTREFQKNICLCFINYTKALIVWIITNGGKLLKRWKPQTVLPVSWETCMQIKKQEIEPCMERQVQDWERSTTRLFIVTLFI